MVVDKNSEGSNSNQSSEISSQSDVSSDSGDYEHLPII